MYTYMTYIYIYHWLILLWIYTYVYITLYVLYTQQQLNEDTIKFTNQNLKHVIICQTGRSRAATGSLGCLRGTPGIPSRLRLRSGRRFISLLRIRIRIRPVWKAHWVAGFSWTENLFTNFKQISEPLLCHKIIQSCLPGIGRNDKASPKSIVGTRVVGQADTAKLRLPQRHPCQWLRLACLRNLSDQSR